MKTVSICGVDGSGKTTLIKRLANLAMTDSALSIATLRCPQYYESGTHRFDSLAMLFENWSQACDTDGDPVRKAVVLFLQMSLYGSMEQDQKRAYPAAKILLRERDPVIDTMVYSPLYVQVLGAHEVRFPDAWSENSEVAGYLQRLHQKLPLGMTELTFATLREYILKFFSQWPEDLAKSCLKLFDASPAHSVIILKMDEPLLKARLALKHAERSGAKEHHEETGLLLKLQDGLVSVAQKLSPTFGFSVEIFELSSSNQDEIEPKLVECLKTWE